MIAELTKHAVRIGFEADPDIKIVRSEVDVRADKGVKS
jgi:sRNA-binding carbon storage regulator CsrA